jgi:hypothetical protein
MSFWLHVMSIIMGILAADFFKKLAENLVEEFE